MRDTVGILEAEFAQFQITCSEDIDRLKDKTVQHDNKLKVQRGTVDDIAADLSSHVKSLLDELHQQSVQIKKLQEDNISPNKKYAKMSEVNANLLKNQSQLEKDVAFLKEQVSALSAETAY